MQNATLKIFFAILLAVILGVGIHFADPGTAIFLLIIWFITGFFSFAVVTIGLFSKKFRFWYLIGFFPFLVGYTFETGIRNYKHKKAERITVQLEHYKMENGKYPDNLLNLNPKIEITGLTYLTDSDHTMYRIEYLMDRFNREYFDSESKKWVTLR